MSKLSKLDIQMAISTRQIKIWKIFFWKSIYRSIVLHVPSFQLSARSSSLFRAFFFTVMEQLFMNYPIYLSTFFVMIIHGNRTIAILFTSGFNTCRMGSLTTLIDMHWHVSPVQVWIDPPIKTDLQRSIGPYFHALFPVSFMLVRVANSSTELST